MKNGKETKSSEIPSKELDWEGFDPDNFNNMLSLPQPLKDKLTKEGFDWRFLNSTSFRENGNMHHGYWRPYKATPEDGITGVNAEGFIQRRDLILGIRPKKITKTFQAHYRERNIRQAGVNKAKAEELRKLAKDAQLDRDVRVYEGYEENN